ncbi:hypothetical protein DL238_10590 [Alteriqipengyuania lutimaris]|uniref:L,D-TPase catalytic domain-containing protein n=2 Tax=Alteriqipengyuania lutimaris TaxID=1538146 RepID=A0A395LM19_9SPHN|nr:hypothetical protein DL238_10590 [Alteriqipengyuania lutimaris]
MALVAGFLLFLPQVIASQKNPSAAPRNDIVFVSNPVVQEVPPSPAPVLTRTRLLTRTRVAGATLPPAVDAALESGVLIVISKGSQHMFVFRDGALWDTSPVSTGKPGKDTPSGVFPILQKRVHHRSNIYSNAPMPHMQRLTWGGIALHAGHLPGYPASHGCIRLPRDFARALYRLTDMDSTTVVVVDQALAVPGEAMRLARAMPAPKPGERGHLVQRPEPRLADLGGAPINLLPEEGEEATGAPATSLAQNEARPVATPRAEEPRVRTARIEPEPVIGGQTIQLAAKGSVDEAEAYWSRISTRFPELEDYRKTITPAVVRSKQYYRLQVTGPDARAMCNAMKQSGADCFPVS